MEALPVVPCAKSVRFSHHVPHWAFIEWIAFLRRLSTKDALLSCGMEMDTGCSLCLRDTETHEHLFFECQYSKEVWIQELHKKHIGRPRFGLSREIG